MPQPKHNSKPWNLLQGQTTTNHLDDVLSTMNDHKRCRSGNGKGKGEPAPLSSNSKKAEHRPQSTAISTEEDDQEEKSSHPNANRMEQTNLTGRITKNTSLDSPQRIKSLTRTPELQEMSQLMAAPPPSAQKNTSRPSESKPKEQKHHAAASPELMPDTPPSPSEKS